MPKRRAPARKKMTGKGFMDFIKGVGNFIKDNKIISTGLSLIPHPYAAVGSKVTGALGLGRKRKPRRKLAGGSMVMTGVRSHMRQGIY